ncbi:hypothetical protein C2M16_18705 [Escherichia coli]|uniref:Uncharacterized protein n=1 Tax=Escherichia coli TaxID=562 RepID=A0A2K3TPP5_ECOLX|nr:hypothetical protein C2M16_18705 [Escherichia coli]
MLQKPSDHNASCQGIKGLSTAFVKKGSRITCNQTMLVVFNNLMALYRVKIFGYKNFYFLSRKYRLSEPIPLYD